MLGRNHTSSSFFTVGDIYIINCEKCGYIIGMDKFGNDRSGYNPATIVDNL